MWDDQVVSLHEDRPYWDLPIIGFEVLEVMFSGRLAVFAYGEGGSPGDPAPRTQIALGGPFIFVTPGGEQQHLDGGGDWQNLTGLLCLRGSRVETAQAARDGGLIITFDNLAGLVAAPDAKYENWEISGPGRLNLVSPPGGGDPRIAV